MQKPVSTELLKHLFLLKKFIPGDQSKQALRFMVRGRVDRFLPPGHWVSPVECNISALLETSRAVDQFGQHPWNLVWPLCDATQFTLAPQTVRQIGRIGPPQVWVEQNAQGLWPDNSGPLLGQTKWQMEISPLCSWIKSTVTHQKEWATVLPISAMGTLSTQIKDVAAIGPKSACENQLLSKPVDCWHHGPCKFLSSGTFSSPKWALNLHPFMHHQELLPSSM